MKVDEAYEKYYDKARRRYDDLYPSEKRILNLLDLKGKRILDVGCAMGGFFEILSSLESSIRYTGVDQSESLLIRARDRYRGTQAEFLQMDANDLQWSSDSFDIVVCASVQPHLRDYKRLITEIYRVSRSQCVIDTRITTGPTTDIGDDELMYNVINMCEMLEYISHLGQLKTFVLHADRIEPNRNRLHSKNYAQVDVTSGLFLIEKGA